MLPIHNRTPADCPHLGQRRPHKDFPGRDERDQDGGPPSRPARENEAGRSITACCVRVVKPTKLIVTQIPVLRNACDEESFNWPLLAARNSKWQVITRPITQIRCHDRYNASTSIVASKASVAASAASHNRRLYMRHSCVIVRIWRGD